MPFGKHSAHWTLAFASVAVGPFGMADQLDAIGTGVISARGSLCACPAVTLALSLRDAATALTGS
jgi:hypothetical protein